MPRAISEWTNAELRDAAYSGDRKLHTLVAEVLRLRSVMGAHNCHDSPVAYAWADWQEREELIERLRAESAAVFANDDYEKQALRNALEEAEAKLHACEVERDAALTLLHNEQTLRDHAEAHVDYLKESND